ncbi:MAG: YwaF family protein [Clostridia bacterium]|nr:YwaF family protein [Clostridia bacterium]
MTTFQKLVYALQWEMERPTNYGAFHIASLLLVVLLTAFLIIRFRNTSDKTLRRILLVAWLVMVVLEVFKQFSFTLDSDDGITARWDFQWYAFPFQFCSTPLYALPLAIFLPEGKVRRAVMTFLCTFSLFAGLAVMLYPNDVFVRTIGIDVQTMVHHGLQVALGIFLAVYNHRHLNKRHFAWSLLVFYAFAAIAMGMNLGVYHLLGIRDTFNMFYISPYFDCTLPVLSGIYKATPYPVFLLIYLVGFALVSAIVYAAEKGLNAGIMHIKHRAAARSGSES